jgi:sarcosine oxidase subunit beta
VAAFVTAGARLGVTSRYGEKALAIESLKGRVTGVITDKGRIAAPSVVVAAGIFGNDLLKPLGHDVPLTIPMVTALRTAPMDSILPQVVGVANADCAGRQEYNGRFRVTSGLQPWHGGLIEPDIASRQPRVLPTPNSIADVARLFSDVVPAFAHAQVEEIWCGLLDLTPDALPVLDTLPELDGVVVAMGFSGHGFGLGPVTGQIVSDLVQGRPSRFPIAPFALNRFVNRRAPAEPLTLHG